MTEQCDPVARVRRLLPSPLDEVSLIDAFPFPTASWLRAVFVASIDGATTVGGRVSVLGNPTDQQLFAMHRAMADLVLVGAGTARAEGYGPVEVDPRWEALRTGRSATAPIAVVSESLNLDFSSPLFRDAPDDARTIVITAPEAPAEQLRRAGDVAEVLVVGDQQVDLAAALAQLRSQGHRWISCEGGPRLCTDLLREQLVDELCLTRAPLLVGSGEFGLLGGSHFDAPVHCGVQSIHASPDGYLYELYRPLY